MLSIIVPTMNRPQFVVRLIDFYARSGRPYHLLIGDSSTAEGLSAVAKRCERDLGSLKVTHEALPGLRDWQCVQRLLPRAETPYATFMGDDDFVVPEGAEACTRFLDRAPDHVGAYGHSVQFRLDREGPYGEVASIGMHAGFQPAIANTAAERLFRHMRNYSVPIFAVHRTEAMRRAYGAEEITERWFAGELLPGAVLTALGKRKGLDVLYQLRQTHAQQYTLEEGLDWISGPGWREASLRFRSYLAEVIREIDTMDPDLAEEYARATLVQYLAMVMGLGMPVHDQWKEPNPNHPLRYLRIALNKMRTRRLLGRRDSGYDAVLRSLKGPEGASE